MKYLKCMVLIYGIVIQIYLSCQYRSFNAHITFGKDKRLLSDPIATVPAVSVIQCASLCAETRACKSFNLGADVCELLGTFYCDSPFAMVEQTGFRYVDIDEDADNEVLENVLSSDGCTKDKRCSVKCVSQTRVVGQACVDTSECNLVNTECRDGLCQCDISFAYNHNNDTCVSECTTYGSSFSRKNNWTLPSFNDGVHLDVENVSVCLEYCKSSYDCRSVEYYPAGHACYTSLSTCYTHSRLCSRNPYFSFYIRNCA